ncbi:MAG TPA: hypothetical protein VF074_06650 [Pyrinomonadaceae bacterium]
MSRAIVVLALLYLFLHPAVCQSVDPQSSGPGMRPVKELASQLPSTEKIRSSGFDFQQLFITHHSGMSPIEGEPTRGARFFVEAKLYGEEAIATSRPSIFLITSSRTRRKLSSVFGISSTSTLRNSKPPGERF